MPTDVTLETSIETANSAKSLRELGKGLKDLIALQAQIGNSSSTDFKKLQDAITKTEGRMGDLKDSFQTLRGSGVERLNSSLSLFREGLANADTDKLKIALEGVGSAMKAIPIFLIVEGIRLLIENWSKLTAVFSSSQQQIKANAESLEKLNEQIAFNNQDTQALLIVKEAELKSLEKQGASLQVIIDKIEEINKLKLGVLKNELKGVDTEMQNLISQITEAKKDLSEDSVTESIFGFFGFGNTEKDVKELEKKLSTLALKRGEIVNNQAKVEIETEQELQSKIDEARKKEEEKNLARIKRKIELSDRELAAEKKQLEDMLAFQAEIDKKRIEAEKKAQEAIASVKDDIFLASIEQGKREFAIEHDALRQSLEGRLQLLEEAKLKELSLVDTNSKAALEIEKKYATLALQEKLKASQQYISLAQNLAGILNATSQLLSENENYRIQQDSYIKDAELENSKNRSQEQIDTEVQKTNKLLNNDNLTEAEREKIKYDSETKQRQIDIASKNAQLAIQRDFDKKSLEVRKAQFERDKKIQLVTASINTAAAIVSALGTVTPYPLAIAAAAGAAIAGGLQIAAIASKKFDDGGAAARTSVAPISNIDTRGGLPTEGSSSAPSTNLNPTGNLTGAGNNNGQIKVVVLEGDIRDVSSKVAVLEDRATFG